MYGSTVSYSSLESFTIGLVGALIFLQFHYLFVWLKGTTNSYVSSMEYTLTDEVGWGGVISFFVGRSENFSFHVPLLFFFVLSFS